MNHIIKLLFLCLFLVASCSQEEINEVLKNHAEMEEQQTLSKSYVKI